MTDQELDEILLHHWPRLVRRAMIDASDEWTKGFVLSIARHGKRPKWRPSPKQQAIMRRLLIELAQHDPEPGELFE